MAWFQRHDQLNVAVTAHDGSAQAHGRPTRPGGGRPRFCRGQRGNGAHRRGGEDLHFAGVCSLLNPGTPPAIPLWQRWPSLPVVVEKGTNQTFFEIGLLLVDWHKLSSFTVCRSHVTI